MGVYQALLRHSMGDRLAYRASLEAQLAADVQNISHAQSALKGESSVVA